MALAERYEQTSRFTDDLNWSGRRSSHEFGVTEFISFVANAFNTRRGFVFLKIEITSFAQIQ